MNDDEETPAAKDEDVTNEEEVRREIELRGWKKTNTWV